MVVMRILLDDVVDQIAISISVSCIMVRSLSWSIRILSRTYDGKRCHTVEVRDGLSARSRN